MQRTERQGIINMDRFLGLVLSGKLSEAKWEIENDPILPYMYFGTISPTDKADCMIDEIIKGLFKNIHGYCSNHTTHAQFYGAYEDGAVAGHSHHYHYILSVDREIFSLDSFRVDYVEKIRGPKSERLFGTKQRFEEYDKSRGGFMYIFNDRKHKPFYHHIAHPLKSNGTTDGNYHKKQCKKKKCSCSDRDQDHYHNRYIIGKYKPHNRIPGKDPNDGQKGTKDFILSEYFRKNKPDNKVPSIEQILTLKEAKDNILKKYKTK